MINGDGFQFRDRSTLSNRLWDVKFGVLKRFVDENLSADGLAAASDCILYRKGRREKWNARDNFSVEFVFYERDYKLNCDGQA